MRVIICSSLAFCLSLTGLAWADSDPAAGTKEQLGRLEGKYFGHSYDADAPESRLSRLEQLIFGEDAGGTVAERVGKILSVSPLEDKTTVSEPDSTTAPPGSGKRSTSAKTVRKNLTEPLPSAENSEGSSNQSLSCEDSLELKDYPHINALEQSILGRTFVGRPLSARLACLETRAFGSPSMLPDFSQRTDALEDFAEKKLHQKPFGMENETAGAPDLLKDKEQAAAASVDDAGKAAPANIPDYPHISVLEKKILGKSYAGQDLLPRLNRLEIAAFGQASGNPDLSRRTDLLERYCQKKEHKKSYPDVNQQAETASTKTGTPQSSGSPVSSRTLAMVANTLLGVAGLGVGPMGLGNGLARFGGGRLSQRQPGMQPDGVDVEREDDPAVFTLNPPPVEAKLLIKVGWCEVKTFGHTFSSLHLTDRLHQLSQQLEFETNKSDLELMDDINALIKIVQLRQSPGGRPIGSAPQAPVN